MIYIISGWPFKFLLIEISKKHGPSWLPRVFFAVPEHGTTGPSSEKSQYANRVRFHVKGLKYSAASLAQDLKSD